MEHIPTRKDALSLLKEYNKSESLINHALAVEGVMRYFARKNGEDEDLWGIIGLIHDLDYEKTGTSTFLVTLPGEKKLQTHCALIVGDNSLSINAFVIRRPDENADKVHEWLLTKNASMYAVTYAINELGDIFLVGRLPLPAVTDVEIDRILGAVLQYSDSSFNQLLELGFASSIRREWAWRVSRGESLSNLKAFEHL